MNEDIEKLLRDRYYLKNENSWEDIAKRVSSIYPEIYEHILNMEFIPSSPTLMNCNTNGERIGTLSSCFPMDISDNIESIFNAVGECAEVTKMAGGVGYDFSYLRGSKEPIKKLGNKTGSGPLPFIDIFNTTLDAVSQTAVRRGAGMAQLSIDHPDILNFINVKKEESKFNRFNFSVRIPNYFYDILEEDPNRIFQVKNVVDNSLFDLEEEGKKISYNDLWNKIIESAWFCSEPGVFNSGIAFDRFSVKNYSEKILANPCNEHIHLPYSSCCLGSINLSKLVEKNKFNWNNFENLIVKSTYFLNNIIDYNNFPLDKIKEVTLSTRPIGIGIMGLAHLFFKLKISYNSKKAIDLSKDIFKYLTLRSMQESVKIAKERGAYKHFDYDTYINANSRFFKGDEDNFKNIDLKKLKNDIKKYGISNSVTTSIAPTGSISFLANTSGGIEPIFSLIYTRKIEKRDKEYDIVHIFDSIFKKYIDLTYDEKDQEKIIQNIISNNGSCQKCKELPDTIKKLFLTSNDLTPFEHLNILEVVANNISMGVSKTVNLPESTTKEEIAEVFLQAYKKGIIGITVFREGSRKSILSSKQENKDNIVEMSAPKRPKSLPCHIYKIRVHGEDWKVFVGILNSHPYEVFAGKVDLVDIPSNIEEGVITKVKSGMYQFEHNDEVLIKDISKLFELGAQEALTRQISANLRHGTPVEYVIDQLQKSYGTIADFNKSILRALKRYMKNKESNNKCPNCGSILEFREGCEYCNNCFWSKCL